MKRETAIIYGLKSYMFLDRRNRHEQWDSPGNGFSSNCLLYIYLLAAKQTSRGGHKLTPLFPITDTVIGKTYRTTPASPWLLSLAEARVALPAVIFEFA
jgi:hypothetical protein